MASAKSPNSAMGINLNEDGICKLSERELKTSEGAESSCNLLVGVRKISEEAENSCNPLMGVHNERVRHPGSMVVPTGSHDREGRPGLCADLNEISEDIEEDPVLSEAKRVKEAAIASSIVNSSAKVVDAVNGSAKFGDFDNRADTVKAILSGKAGEEQDLGIKSRCIALENCGGSVASSAHTTELGVSGEVNHTEEPKVSPMEEPFDQQGNLNMAKNSNLCTLERTPSSMHDTNSSSEIPVSSDAPMKRCTEVFASATTNIDRTQGSGSAQDATKFDGEKHSVQLPSEAKATSPSCISKEHNFSVGDLVWCKVKYHPWWPGQIFDPSDASEAARQLQKKDRLLVANFGDQTFAWCELSHLKPFRENFAKLAKLSAAKVFCNAVDKALNELARQEQFGLTCSCLSGKSHSKLENKVISNGGLREGAVVNNHRRVSLAATAFDPWKLLTYVRELAESPFTDNPLEITMFRTQVYCFYAAQRHLAFGETSSEVLLKHASISENLFSTPKNVKSNNSSPGKHKQSSNGRQSAKNKKKLFRGSQGYDASEQDDLSLKNSTETRKRPQKEKERWSGRKLSQSTSKKQRKNEYIFASGGYRVGAKGWQEKQNMHTVSPISGTAQGDTKKVSKSFKIGECIRKIASQLSGSPPIIKSIDPTVERMLEDGKKAKLESMEHIPRSPLSWIKSPLPFKEDYSIKESLFELFLVAQSPIYFLEENDIFSRVTNIFLKFRGELFEKDSVYPSYRRASKNSSKITVSPSIDDSDDSNWTDTTIASRPKGHRARRKRKVESQAKDSENKPKRRVRSSDSTPSKKVKKLKDHVRSPVTTLSKEVPHSAANNLTDSPQESPTALFMKFPPGFAFPSETELKEMFVHYGQISETQFFSDSGCAQVIFRKCSDAEAAFYGATANKIFGPATVSFRLRYLTSRRKTDTVQIEDPREAEMRILSEDENTSRKLEDAKENEGQSHASGVSVVEAIGASN